MPRCSRAVGAFLTPTEGSDARGDRPAHRVLGRAGGSTVEQMDPEHHDLVLAIVSHLPHIIAYNIVGTADDLEGG